MDSFTDESISPIDEMIRNGIAISHSTDKSIYTLNEESIYTLIDKVIDTYGNDELCKFKRAGRSNPIHLWEGTAYENLDIKIKNKYNHFTGRLISVCKILYSDNIDAINNLNIELKELVVADNLTDDANLTTLFDKLDLGAGVKMEVGGQSGGSPSPFSDALAIAMKISKMLDPSVALPAALTNIRPVIISTWIKSLIEKANSKQSEYISFLFNDILTPIFPSIVFSLQSIGYAVENQDLLIEYIAVYGPIYINRIQEASITVRDVVETGAKKGEKGLMDQIAHMETSLANLAFSDLSFHLENVNSDQMDKQTDRLASLARMTQQLTSAKVSADEVNTELVEQKKMLIDVKKIVADTNQFLFQANLASEELKLINAELAKLTNPGEKRKASIGFKSAAEPSEPKKAVEKRDRDEGYEGDEAKIPRVETVETVETVKGGKRKTKKQKKKASKTKKPKRSQKKQTKKRKQRKTQQKKAKK